MHGRIQLDEPEETIDSDSNTTAARPSMTPTPLPWGQLFILLWLRFCESSATTSVYPYLKELLVSVTGGDERKVGYYAGLMDVLYYSTETLTVMQWSRMSDHIGRKPVLLMGLTGLGLAMYCFGLSETFWGVVASRCLFAVTNGNYGVVKSTIGEITDFSNSANAFAVFHVPWTIGSAIGPLLGGLLAKPHEQYPNLFTSPFWTKHPYFLPCIAVVGIVVVGFFLTSMFFDETVPGSPLYKDAPIGPADQLEPLMGSPGGDRSTVVDGGPVPIRLLLVPRILLPVLNYCALAYCNASFNVLQPIVLATTVENGGLGLSPRMIGFTLSACGAGNAVFQAFCCPIIIRRFGIKQVFRVSILSLIPMFALYPVMNIFARRVGISPLVIFLLVCQLSLSFIMDLGYSCIYMYINAAAPNKRSLGATNGLSQTLVSISRIIAPALASTLLSFSMEYNLLGGYAVYVVMIGFCCLSLLLVAQLPQQLWDDNKQAP